MKPVLALVVNYRANWLLTFSVLIFLALMWVAYRVYRGEMRRRLEMALEARVEERTRIARELHDTLLQSFQALLLRFKTGSELLPGRPLEAKNLLDSTIQQAAEAISEGRDAVLGLRTSKTPIHDLALAISTLGEELVTAGTNGRSPGFCVNVEGRARHVHPVLRGEIYSICAEALRNSFRHAEPGRVEVEIRYDSEQFRLRVRDDGKGIDSSIISGDGSGHHYGLSGMKERAELIGGNLVVWSEIGSGTEVELRVPASIAFASAAKSRRLGWNSVAMSEGLSNKSGRRPFLSGLLAGGND